MLQQLPANGLEGHANGCGQAAQWPVLAAGMSKALFPQRTDSLHRQQHRGLTDPPPTQARLCGDLQ